MATEVGVSTLSRERADANVPYPPSVVDQFMAWADRLPGPVWLFYFALLVALIVFVHAAAWIDGSLSFGVFDLYRISIPIYPVSVLALMHYLDRVARRALATFRPALGTSDADNAWIEYELTTLPRRPTRRVMAVSLAFTAAFVVFTPYLADAIRQSPGLVVVDVAMYVIVFALIVVFVYHTLRQLRMVSFIHTRAKNVNLFQRTPLYAFSMLTAQTGMGLLLLNYVSVLTDPATFVNPALLGLTISTSLVAVACFVLPLRGMHDRIGSEKERLLAEANTRLEATIQEVYRRADTHNLEGIDQLNRLMATLVTTRELLSKIPTWPWEAVTLTGFITVILLPFVIELFIEILARFFL